jgi:hypothetical protein
MQLHIQVQLHKYPLNTNNRKPSYELTFKYQIKKILHIKFKIYMQLFIHMQLSTYMQLYIHMQLHIYL